MYYSTSVSFTESFPLKMVWLNPKLIQKILQSVSQKPRRSEWSYHKLQSEHVMNVKHLLSHGWVDRNSSLWGNMGISDAHLGMDTIIIISVFQKWKGTQFLAYEDGTQMFCSDDLYFFSLYFSHH